MLKFQKKNCIIRVYFGFRFSLPITPIIPTITSQCIFLLQLSTIRRYRYIIMYNAHFVTPNCSLFLRIKATLRQHGVVHRWFSLIINVWAGFLCDVVSDGMHHKKKRITNVFWRNFCVCRVRLIGAFGLKRFRRIQPAPTCESLEMIALIISYYEYYKSIMST